MNTLIIFATKYGCTEKCSNMLADKLTGNIKVVNIRNKPIIDLTEYETIILGGSIIGGKIDSSLQKFYKNNMDMLLQKKTGLFICAAIDQKAEEELKNNFPDQLIEHSSAIGYFGYEFILEKMNFAIRLLVKKMSDINNSISRISENNIDIFVKEILK